MKRADRVAHPAGMRLAVVVAVVASSSWLLAAGFAGNGFDQVAADEAVLRAANIPTDGPSLLDYFRAQTASDADLTAIDALVRDLGDPLFRKRQRASVELLRRGTAALPALRKAAHSGDAEVVQRATECLRQIEEAKNSALPTAAARLLAVRRPPGAAAVLLGYLPTAEEAVADEVRAALAAVAKANPADPDLRTALADAHPQRRGAAAAALAASGAADAVALAGTLLRDPAPAVRLRVGMALAVARERVAVPVLIDLLGELPPEEAWPAEDLLLHLAGDDAPTTPLGTDAEKRKKCRDDWNAWWAAHADTADFTQISGPVALRGLTIIAQLQTPANGSLVEIGPDRQVRWAINSPINGLGVPFSLQYLPDEHVLVAEYTSGRVTERDFSGKVVWEKVVAQPVAGQRLPGGNTLIATRARLLEVNGRGEEVWSAIYGDIASAARRRDGKTVVVTVSAPQQPSRCALLDEAGKELKSFPVGRCQNFAGIDVLPGGRVLIPESFDNRVAEYDAGGQRIWSATVECPTSAMRLPDGHVLVASRDGMFVAELDRGGRVVWQYKSPEGWRPLVARRR